MANKENIVLRPLTSLTRQHIIQHLTFLRIGREPATTPSFTGPLAAENRRSTRPAVALVAFEQLIVREFVQLAVGMQEDDGASNAFASETHELRSLFRVSGDVENAKAGHLLEVSGLGDAVGDFVDGG